MLDVFNFASPQTANYQEFYGGGTTRDWIKPRGASMVRMLLIGAGGGGQASTTGNYIGGGGSGAITQWIGPAIFIPDVLRVSIGAGGNAAVGGATSIIYQAKDGTGYTLLTANGGGLGTGSVGGAAATASSNNYFGAAGIFSSTAGQSGAATGTAITASTTTFLSGGAGGNNTSLAGGNVANKYGYPTVSGGAGTIGGKGGDGFFLMRPIMFGSGGAGGGGGGNGVGGNGGIGCGGGGAGRSATGTTASGNGGDGAVFIWSW